MALFNYATKEITLKIVYYGPGLSGKTTNLQHLHSSLDPQRRGKLLSLATEADRTLFFDFMPVELGKIKGFSIRFQLYTVPGQVRYNATRKLVLKGADAIVFVADSQEQMLEENLESLRNMRENLIANNLNPDDIPVVMQYNKRDLPNKLPVDELNKKLNDKGYPFFEAVAVEGKGVDETFQSITRGLLKHISQKHKIDIKPQGQVTTEEEKPKIKPIEKPVRPVGTERVSPIEKRPSAYESMLFKIQDEISSIRGALSDNESMREEINRLSESVDKLNETLKRLSAKQEEAVSLLIKIKESMDNAKTKKRWLFFG